MNEFTLQQLSTSAKDRILEIGFGGGDLLEKILSTRSSEYVAGVDLSIDMVNLVGHRLRYYIQSGRAEVRRGNIEALPYANGEFYEGLQCQYAVLLAKSVCCTCGVPSRSEARGRDSALL